MTALPFFRKTSFAIGIVAVSIVVGAVYMDAQDSSPGEIAMVHEQHAGLAGPKNCEACHGRNGQSMAEACQGCHEDIEQQLAQGTGFHGTIASYLVKDCAKCHSEHHGKEFPITNERSFVLAGSAAPPWFKHAGFDFHLTDKHLQVGCEKCHPNANVTLLALGQKRFLGLSQECASCHQDVHDGTYGQDCASCHGQQHAFSRVAEFEHTPALALVGGHGKAACTDCHQSDSPQSVAALISASSTAGTAPARHRTCGECHSSPHTEQFLDSVSLELKATTDTSCQHCHSAVHETFIGPQATLDSHLHACTGFPLDAPHDKLACSDCHAEFGQQKLELGSFDRSYPGRHPDDCRTCHGDPHQGQFEVGAYRGTNCLTCHHRHTFVPSSFTHVDHHRTRFPLVGAHFQVACNQCHKDDMEKTSQPVADKGLASSKRKEVKTPGRPQLSELAESKSAPVRVFHGTPTSCKACHDDPHRRQFEHGPFRGKDCSVCHDEHSFGHSTFSVEQHAQTRFPLTGAHLAVACNSCHKRPKGSPGDRRASPVSSSPVTYRTPAKETLLEANNVKPIGERRLPRRDVIDPRIFRGTPAECHTCHADVHNGQFDLPHLPVTTAGNNSCARCHTTESFRQLRLESFDHPSWTGYTLRGGHARARCVDCHRRTRLTDSRGRTFGRIVDRNCQSCHRDPHVAQFGPTSTVSCTQCHVEGDSFRELVFDHQRHSRFPLDQDHATLACSACHKPQHLPDGSTAIRYKPLGTQCGDCHVPRGPRRAGGREPR